MAEVAESHSNGNGKHSLDDDSVDSPVKAKLLKAENGDAVAKQPSATNTNLKDDDTSATADSTPAVDDEKSVEASNDSNGVIDVAALQAGGDQSNNKSDFNESESAGAVSTGGVGDESNTTNTNDLGITNSSTNDLRNENTNESNGGGAGDDGGLLVSGSRRRVKEASDENSADNYEDDEDDEDDDVGPGGEDDEGGEDEDDDDEVDEDEEDDEGEEGEEDEEDGGEE